MRRIFVLETEPRDNGALHARYVLWAVVPTARQPFWQTRQGSDFTSAVQDGSVTAAELTALQSGSVVEKASDTEWPPGTTFAQAQTFLKTEATAWQALVNNYNPWSHYGTSFDDSTNQWTVKAVA